MNLGDLLTDADTIPGVTISVGTEVLDRIDAVPGTYNFACTVTTGLPPDAVAIRIGQVDAEARYVSWTWEEERQARARLAAARRDRT